MRSTNVYAGTAENFETGNDARGTRSAEIRLFARDAIESDAKKSQSLSLGIAAHRNAGKYEKSLAEAYSCADSWPIGKPEELRLALTVTLGSSGLVASLPVGPV